VRKSILTQTAAALVSEVKNFSDNQEVRSLHLRLNPEKLGTVDLKIQSDDKGNLTASITTEHETARHTLSEGIAQLRHELEQAGFQISNLNVNIQQHQGSNTQAGGQQKQESSNRESAFGLAASDDTQNNTESDDDSDRLFSKRA
jgi:flagellar hook-length control protein FliK